MLDAGLLVQLMSADHKPASEAHPSSSRCLLIAGAHVSSVELAAAHLFALGPHSLIDTSVLQVLDAALSAQTVGLVTQEQYKRKLAQLQEEGVPTEAPKVSTCCFSATSPWTCGCGDVSGTAVCGPLMRKVFISEFVGWVAQLQNGEVPTETPVVTPRHHVRQFEMHIWWPAMSGSAADTLAL